MASGLSRSTRAGLILLGAFLLSFALIRISTRLMRSPKVPWWPGSIKTGGLHVHHLVFGIVMMLLFGFLAIALPLSGAWLDVVAAGFGIGAGLTLDEYALWLHLEDVYWSEEGRRSVDAVIVAAVVAALILLGARPLSTSDTELGGGDRRSRSSSSSGCRWARCSKVASCSASLGLVFPPLAFDRRRAPGQADVTLGALALSAPTGGGCAGRPPALNAAPHATAAGRTGSPGRRAWSAPTGSPSPEAECRATGAEAAMGPRAPACRTDAWALVQSSQST